MRLIDADALGKPIYAEDDNLTGAMMTCDEIDMYNEGIDAAWNRIKQAPTIDAEPVRHGKWIEHLNYKEERDGYYWCPLCQKMATREYNYCPNCGAKMDLEGSI